MTIKVIGISNVVGKGGGMRVPFSAVYFQVKVVNDASKKHNSIKHRINSSPLASLSASSVHLSSLPAKTDETKNTSESQKSCRSSNPGSALNQRNAVGIIGGVSVLSTLIFLEKIVWWSSRDGGESIPFIVCSDPVLKHEAHKPIKAMTAATSYHSAYSDNGENRVFTGLDQDGVVENLKQKRLFLEEGGAQCIVMPCHLCHAWYGEISKGCKLPFLHVAECVCRELKEAKFKPLEAGSGVKIGVIATNATLMAGFYQEKLQNEGFEVVVPDKATMENIVNPAITSLKQKDKEGARNLLRIAIQLLLVRAANTVIIASDELQGLLPFDDPLSKKYIDPMDSLARSAVTWAKSVNMPKRSLYDT